MRQLALVRPRKRLFLGLASLSLIVSACVMFGLWLIMSPGLQRIHAWLPVIVAVVLVLAVLVIALGVLLIVLAVLGVHVLATARRIAWWAINLMFPVALILGRLARIDRETIERSFIEVSNHLVRNRHLRFDPDRVLILAPHCIQLDVCRHKVTRKVDNCKRCGKCNVGDLLDLSQRLGVHLAVVPGGTLARQVIKTIRPRAVLAVACERDLVTGIQDVFPLPVVGLLNDRPQGPCCNTRVDVALVERSVRLLTDARTSP
jgi:hypothetical protein